MAVRTIRIVYPGQNTPSLGRSDSPEYARWLQKMSQAFASQGWRVVSQGPTMSSTNVDEDELCLESDGGPLPRSVLEAALRQAGIAAHYWSGDVDETA
jgi:hypothetical protein